MKDTIIIKMVLGHLVNILKRNIVEFVLIV